MEVLPIQHLIPSVQCRRCQTSGLLEGLENPRVSFLTKRVKIHMGHSCTVPCYSKAVDFHEFQGFAEPFRLLPASEANICTESSLEEELCNYFKTPESNSFYLMQLATSSEFGSSLSNVNAAVLLCLIGENGDSILQRIPSVSLVNPGHSEEANISGQFCFQRGSVDNITFKGPKLGKIEAIWIGLESGSWRLGRMGLIVMSPHGELSLSSVGDEKKANRYFGLQYVFEISNILLGEGGGVSVVELRPRQVIELPVVDFMTLSNMGLLYQESSPSNPKVSAEQGMKEYTDLKLSLLLYDAVLIFAGTSIAAFSTDRGIACAFLFGGLCGFVYLLLLQRSVDGLSGPTGLAINSKRENPIQILGGFKGPLSTLALTLISWVIALKYGLGGKSAVLLSPQEVLAGVAGFLTSKVAVVLAAFKPI